MISNADYVILHNHSAYSKLDGLSGIDELTLTAKLMGFPALALTDHGNVGGWIKFHQSAKKKKYKIASLTNRTLLNTSVKYNIIKDSDDKETEIEVEATLKPILGIETYLARNHELGGKEGNPDGRKGNRHLILLAKNEEGYKNLATLSQIAFTHGQYGGDPRIDLNLLAEYHTGIICGSACLSGVINSNLLRGRYDEAKKVSTILKDIFKEDLYLEVMYHGIDQEGIIIPEIIKLGRELGIKVCATNDSHYCHKSQATSQEVLMCMSTSKCIKDPKRLHHAYDEFYMKSADEMSKIFRGYPEVLTNTVDIAERIEEVVRTSTMRLPKFDVVSARQTVNLSNETDHEKGKKILDGLFIKEFENPEDVKTQDDIFEEAYAFMVELVEKGMRELNWHNSPKHIEALKSELRDTRIAWESNRMHFATYFLMEWDCVNFAKNEGILTGAGRGSGYGSLLLRCLGICYGPDPLEQGLIFERFLGFDTVLFLNENDLGIGLEGIVETTEKEELSEEEMEIVEV